MKITRKKSFLDSLFLLTISLVALVGGGFLLLGNSILPQGQGGGPATVLGFTGTVTSDGVVYTSRGDYAEVTGVIGTPENINILAAVGSPELPVTHIAADVFRGQTSIKSITIGENVTFIGDRAFGECTNVTSLNWNAVQLSAPPSVATWHFFRNLGKTAGGVTVTFGDKVEEIPERLFYTNEIDYENISRDPNIVGSVIIPDSVISIGGWAFYKKPGITEITIGKGLKNFGASVFADCVNVTALNWNAVSYATAFHGGLNHPFYDLGNNGKGVTLTFGESVIFIPGNFLYYTRGDSLGVVAALPNVVGTLTIPAKVTLIGTSAFRGCTGITNLNWNAENYSSSISIYYGDHPFYAFGRNYGTNDSLGLNVTIGDNVQRIPANLLYVLAPAYRPDVQSVTIGESVTNIGNNAFSGCTNAKTLVWNATDYTAAFTNVYGNHPFYDFGINFNSDLGVSVTIGNNVKRIPDNFLGLSRDFEEHRPYVTSVTFEDDSSVEYIGQRAFYCLTTLTDISIPESVTEIRDHAFYNCSSLQSIVIPEGITEIGHFTFAYCTSLTSITIPDSVTVFGSYVFHQCINLPEIKIPAGVTNIGRYAFYNCQSLTSLEIPNGVKLIREFTFAYCANLKSIVLPNTITKMEDYVFHQCTSLESVELPSKIKSIGEFMFYNCTSLTSVVIPAGVTTIGDYAFYKCASLSVAIPAGVTSIGYRAFTGVLRIL